MAVSEYAAVTETVSTTEWSFVTDSAGPDADATDGVFQFFLDVSALLKGDKFTITLYEKVNSGSTQRVVRSWRLANAQSEPLWSSPSFILMHGWDLTVVKTAGTDRSIVGSVRKAA